MGLKGLLAAAVCAAVVFASAGAVFDFGTASSRMTGGGAAFSLNPISLGHPAAAAALTTRPLDIRSEAAGTARAVIRESHKIGEGDTLAHVLKRANIKGGEADAAIRAFIKSYNPRKLRAGQKIIVHFDAIMAAASERPSKRRFTGFAFSPDRKRDVLVERDSEGAFSSQIIAKGLERHFVRVSGQIESSLFLAGVRAGLPMSVMAELIRIYSWDVDFQRDIRKGDGFDVLYEEVRTTGGAFVETGDIFYSALTLSGDHKGLYRHVAADGVRDYFDADGEGARKALMRTPIDGARLTSGFGKRRHPILGYTKLHKGVDFAAPSGTPVYAAGDGVVEYAGRKGAYGKFVRIRHNSRYKTAYAHMKAYGPGVRAGKRVRQGHVIGYVGSTGRSTGPHLHYEVLVEGRQVNPLRVKMPSGRKLKGRELERFLAEIARIDERFTALEQPARTKVAEKTSAR